MTSRGHISDEDLARLRRELEPLIGYEFGILSIPEQTLVNFEPSQVGTIVGTLMDACLPFLPGIPDVGISKHAGILGEREGYPDFAHESGTRLELKLLYVDNPEIEMKSPPTPREASARLTQKVTVKNVDPTRDAMLLIAYQLQRNSRDMTQCSPTIVDLGLFPMSELIRARDQRMLEAGGRWFGDFETPTIPSRIGRAKLRRGQSLDTTAYGRMESEGRDFNEDTNFGKLKRVPHKQLQGFLKRHGATYARRGNSDDPWTLD